jgi:type VI secretion system secreted protein Hcp
VELGRFGGTEDQTGAGRGAGKPSFQDLAIEKLVDLASPLLLAATVRGSRISDAVLTVRRAGTPPQEFLVIRLKDVVVTSVSLDETKEPSRPSENIKLNFGQIEFDYTLYKPDGSKDKEESFKWDVAASKTP